MEALGIMADFRLPYYFYEVNTFSVALRLILAVVLGGIIGMERGANSHPAGFRTHILVCIGAALAMMTDQYICQTMSPGADPARLGAQVITGVGFLGVGTIFATGKYKIRGLTTAAGLWASACLGLALGIGFYSGAVIGAVLIFFSLAILPRFEQRFYHRSRLLNLYIEIENMDSWRAFSNKLRNMGITVLETQPGHSDIINPDGIAFYVSAKLPRGLNFDDIKIELNEVQGLNLLEEV